MINPVNEGLFSLILMMIVFGIIGNDYWSFTIPYIYLKINELYVVGCGIFCTVSAGMSLYHVFKKFGFLDTMKMFLFVTYILLGTILLIFSLPKYFLMSHLFSIGYCFGFLFAKLTVLLLD